MTVSRRGTSYQAAFSHKGNRYRRQFATELEAQQWEADSLAGLLRGVAPAMGEQARATTAASSGKPHTLGELLAYVTDSRWGVQKSAKTAAINASAVVRIMGAETPVLSVDAMRVGKLVSTMRAEGAALATINRKLSALNVMLTVAEELYPSFKRPKVKLFKEHEGRIRRVTPEEETLALGYFSLTADRDMEDYTIVSLDTGLRQEEVLLLDAQRCGDASFVKVYGEDAKGKRNRAVPVTSRVASVIARRLKAHPKGPIFPGLDKDTVRRRWDAMRGSLGLADDAEFTPHILRHEFCSRLADLDVSVQVIQRLAGHADIKTTLRYIHLSPNTLKAAIRRLEPATQVDVEPRIHAADGVADRATSAGHTTPRPWSGAA